MRHLAILGSTGSIGRQTLEVVQAHPEHFQVTSLAAGRNINELTKQIQEFSPQTVCVEREEDARILAQQFPKLTVLHGAQGLVELARDSASDTVVVSVTGVTGLIPTLEALKAKKRVGLANKETLVAGGSIVMPLAKDGELYPVDSEHSAIWQCLQGERSPSRLILTASGGALRDMPLDQLAKATASQALAHPTWRMGAKITVDCATMMNKGLEIIEAHWLFGLPYSQIDVVLHPQSIVHSMVEYVDGSVKAQLGLPDMRLPIQYALSYPERLTGMPEKLNWSQMNLTFHEPDPARYPALGLAYEAGKAGGTAPVVLNAANEVAVAAFLADRIPFGKIVPVVERVLEKHTPTEVRDLEDILAIDKWARQEAERIL